MTDPPFADVEYRTATVERLRRGLEHRISRYVADSLHVSDRADRLSGDLVVRVEYDLLTEKLPPSTLAEWISYEHPAAVGSGSTTDPRHATWLDMWKDAMRGRWWARWVGSRRWRVRYVQTPVRYVHREPVQCDHRVTVDIRDAWTYPKATAVLPGRDFGHPVLESDAGIRSVHYVRPEWEIPC